MSQPTYLLVHLHWNQEIPMIQLLCSCAGLGTLPSIPPEIRMAAMRGIRIMILIDLDGGFNPHPLGGKLEQRYASNACER